MWAMTRAKGRCEMCGTNQRQLHVHHKTYERFGNEHPLDLVVLCDRCHKKAHDPNGNSILEPRSKKQRVTKAICKKQKVYKKDSFVSLSDEELLLGKNYSFTQKRSVMAALQAISSTRKTGKISESRKLVILKKFAQYPPEVVEFGCDVYVQRSYSEQGKRENYLIAIIRNEATYRELKKKKDTQKPKVDPETQWRDGNRVYSRETMESQREDLVRAWDENRNTDPAKVSRVNRCMHERPQWDWA